MEFSKEGTQVGGCNQLRVQKNAKAIKCSVGFLEGKMAGAHYKDSLLMVTKSLVKCFAKASIALR